ncbi:translocation protein TolB [Phycisphaerae bacterium RAS1]|nr:translocation protein TolB [Phycisphaerae bacterium RAS1]
MGPMKHVLCCCGIVLHAVAASLGQGVRPAVELRAHERPVLALAFSPDGKRLASVADDEKLIIWDLDAKAAYATFDGHATNQNRVCWTPDGKRLVAIGNDSNIRVWDVENKKAFKAIPAGDISGGPRGLALSPDGARIAVVGRSTLRLFDFESAKQAASYTVHEQYGVQAVAWSADGKTIATAGTDRKLNLVNAADGAVLRACETDGRGVCAAFAPDGKTVYVGTDSQYLQAFDVSSGEGGKLLEKSLPILDIQPTAGGTQLVVGGPGHGPLIMELPQRKIREPKLDSDDWVKAAAVSPDGKLVAGGANGGAIYLWPVGR